MVLLSAFAACGLAAAKPQAALVQLPALGAVVSDVGLLRVLRAGAAAGTGRAAAVDHDLAPEDGHAVAADVDEVRPRLDGDLHARLQHQGLAGLDVDLLARVQGVVAADLVLALAADLLRQVLAVL